MLLNQSSSSASNTFEKPPPFICAAETDQKQRNEKEQSNSFVSCKCGKSRMAMILGSCWLCHGEDLSAHVSELERRWPGVNIESRWVFLGGTRGNLSLLLLLCELN